jgi:hypothetical protein
MVSKMKFIIWLLLGAQISQAAVAPLKFRWDGEKRPQCQHLVEIFFSELRSMAAERPIELEAVSSPTPRQPAQNENILHLKCAETTPTLVVSDGQEALTLRYLAKADGFDSTDWIPFQERYLRPKPIETSDLALPASKADGLSTISADIKSSSSPIYHRWWFWSLVGGVSLGAYLISRGASKSSSVNVEIH